MQHVRQEISQFEEKLQLQAFYDWLEEKENVGKRCRELVRKLLGNTDDDIFNKMNKIMLEITAKVLMIKFSSVLCSLKEWTH